MSDRSVEVEEILELARQVQETNRLAREQLSRVGGSSSTATRGFLQGVLVGMCVMTCVATWIGLVLFAMDIHDLRAWRDQHSNMIGQMKAEITQLKGK